jgi:glycosyltransferase involved in cell wall biosynthesis
MSEITRKKLYLITTVARTMTFFKGQASLWQQSFDVKAIASEEERLKEFAEEEGIGFMYMPMHREISPLSDMSCLFKLVFLFIKDRPYIVHGNTPKASLLSMVAAWLTRRPVRIYMCHGLRYQTCYGVTRKILMLMERISCYCATHVIGVSEGVCKQLVTDHLCEERKTKVVGYGTAGGIDINRFSQQAIEGFLPIREQLRIPANDFVFCFVGRIVQDKGINELVTAFDRLSYRYDNIHLLLVGPEEKELDPISEESEIRIGNNKRIYAVGRQSDVRPFLSGSDAFVLPSYREGVGMVLLEANAMGVPCMASNIIGCRDVVTPGINGELFEPRNEESLYKKMEDWIVHPDKVAALAANCRPYVKERYASASVHRAYYSEYCSLAGLDSSC